MKFKIILGIFLTIVGLPLSFYLAFIGEGLALRYRLMNGTLGMFVGHLFYPSGTDTFGSLAKQGKIEVCVDGILFFLLICGIVLFLRNRSKLMQRID